MGWRFWKKEREGDRVATSTVERTPPPAPTAPAPERPAGGDGLRLSSFAFEMPHDPTPPPLAGDVVAEGLSPQPTPAPSDASQVLPRGAGISTLGRRLGRSAPLAQPLVVPSLREQAIVYRLAAEARGAEPEVALALWAAYLELCPEDGQAWFEQGRLALTVGLVGEGRRAFEEARRRAPELAHAHAALAFLSGREGDWVRAVELYEEATALADRDLDLLEALADAQEQAGRGEAAAATRQRLLEHRAGGVL